MLEINMDNFNDICLRIIKNYFDDNLNNYLKDPIKRLENKKEYL